MMTWCSWFFTSIFFQIIFFSDTISIYFLLSDPWCTPWCSYRPWPLCWCSWKTPMLRPSTRTWRPLTIILNASYIRWIYFATLFYFSLIFHFSYPWTSFLHSRVMGKQYHHEVCWKSIFQHTFRPLKKKKIFRIFSKK